MPQCVVKTVGSQKTVRSWGAVCLVVTVPQDCSGTPRASVCPPACAPASLELSAMHLAVSPRRTVTTGEGGGLGGGRELGGKEMELREERPGL